MLDYEKLFAQAKADKYVEYRHPFDAPYADPERMTDSQIVMWNYFREHIEKAPVLAMIAAKGSGKTHFGSAFAFHMGQTYVGSIGCLISNSYQQTKDNGGKQFMDMAKTLGYQAEFFTSKKIKGQSVTNLYIVDLDGKGYEEGNIFYMLVRSMDAVTKLEGIEIDWLWVEEVQHAPKDAFELALTRIRGHGSPNCVFIAGMSDDEIHWQYKKIPEMGALEKEKRDAGAQVIFTDPTTGEETELFGILTEPNVYENRKNLKPDYIPKLYQNYDKEMAERMIFGRRTAMHSNKVAYAYKDWLHRTGRMSALCAHYDPFSRIILSWDFNYANMHVTLWQEKEWNDEWLTEDVTLNLDGTLSFHGEPLDDIRNVAWPDRQILAQVGEFELDNGGTEQMCQKIISEFGEHASGWTVIGDAAGQQHKSSSSTTDWAIIESYFAHLESTTIIKGLKATPNFKLGRTTYVNPDKQNTINNLNTQLQTADGKVHMCFLPASEYRRGGAARSVHAMKRLENGQVDERVDKSEDKDQPFTHYFDTVRYALWYWRGSETMYTKERFKSQMNTLAEDARTSRSDWDQGSSDWDDGMVFGTAGGGSVF